MPSLKKGEGIFSNWIFWIFVLLAVVVGGLYFWMDGFRKQYYAVYLRTGEIYFGQISYFPRMAMNDPLILQLTGDKENPFSISRFKDSFWGPEGKIYLGGDNVVWKARIAEGSKMMEALKNPDLVTKSNTAAAEEQPAATTPAEEKKE
ncbi:MAG: hypothetical protein WC435_00035 [Candidatus Paceibacterota bacterium]